MKKGRSWITFGVLGEPLGNSASLPKPNLTGACPHTLLSLLESRAWRSGTRSHVGALLIFLCIHASRKLLPLYHIACTLCNFIILQVKINHIMSCNDCSFILVLGVDTNNWYIFTHVGYKPTNHVTADVDTKSLFHHQVFYISYCSLFSGKTLNYVYSNIPFKSPFLLFVICYTNVHQVLYSCMKVGI